MNRKYQLEKRIQLSRNDVKIKVAEMKKAMAAGRFFSATDCTNEHKLDS
jgi:hypothetical protein